MLARHEIGASRQLPTFALMKILLTGATGYVGKRLLPALVRNGHKVVCCVRDTHRFNPPDSLRQSIEVIECDLLDPESLNSIPDDIDGAFYLVHSMSASSDYRDLERTSAVHFRERLNRTRARHVVYLSGIVNEKSLSEHLGSRKQVETELAGGRFHLTTFRAGIIIGSGSASFEIIRDLVEKLPLMIAPRWLYTRCQPIAVGDVIRFLEKAIGNEKLYATNYDIGGPDVLSYKQMLLGYAKARALRRIILVVPVMTPRLSSYWLYFITATSYKLAQALVDSMKVEVVCRHSDINEMLDIRPVGYAAALQDIVKEVESNQVVSSWKDALVEADSPLRLSDFIEVPVHGCFADRRSRAMANRQVTLDRIWSIGGRTGWYYAGWLWKLRGFFDKLAGGVGLRRGRTHPTRIAAGDVVDFWRVLYANKTEGRLLLFAEMKLPGEAWLEFRIEGPLLIQTATFRPRGLAGRLYWYLVYPFHGMIFNGMISRLCTESDKP